MRQPDRHYTMFCSNPFRLRWRNESALRNLASDLEPGINDNIYFIATFISFTLLLLVHQLGKCRLRQIHHLQLSSSIDGWWSDRITRWSVLARPFYGAAFQVYHGAPLLFPDSATVVGEGKKNGINYVSSLLLTFRSDLDLECIPVDWISILQNSSCHERWWSADDDRYEGETVRLIPGIITDRSMCVFQSSAFFYQIPSTSFGSIDMDRQTVAQPLQCCLGAVCLLMDNNDSCMQTERESKVVVAISQSVYVRSVLICIKLIFCMNSCTNMVNHGTVQSVARSPTVNRSN